MAHSASRTVARAALALALSESHGEEARLKDELRRRSVRAAGVDFGGDFVPSVPRLVERAVVAARREGVVAATHAEEGAVAGAAHEAVAQVAPKAIGLNVGGKIGIARTGDHLAVAVFFAIGLLHLDDVAVGLAHRAVPPEGQASGGGGEGRE